MKRIIALFLACLMIMSLALTGCESATQDGSTTDPGSNTGQNTDQEDNNDNQGDNNETATVEDDPSVKTFNIMPLQTKFLI